MNQKTFLRTQDEPLVEDVECADAELVKELIVLLIFNSTLDIKLGC
jgi:hypothetical protein